MNKYSAVYPKSDIEALNDKILDIEKSLRDIFSELNHLRNTVNGLCKVEQIRSHKALHGKIKKLDI